MNVTHFLNTTVEMSLQDINYRTLDGLFFGIDNVLIEIDRMPILDDLQNYLQVIN